MVQFRMINVVQSLDKWRCCRASWFPLLSRAPTLEQWSLRPLGRLGWGASCPGRYLIPSTSGPISAIGRNCRQCLGVRGVSRLPPGRFSWVRVKGGGGSPAPSLFGTPSVATLGGQSEAPPPQKKKKKKNKKKTPDPVAITGSPFHAKSRSEYGFALLRLVPRIFTC